MSETMEKGKVGPGHYVIEGHDVKRPEGKSKGWVITYDGEEIGTAVRMSDVEQIIHDRVTHPDWTNGATPDTEPHTHTEHVPDCAACVLVAASERARTVLNDEDARGQAVKQSGISLRPDAAIQWTEAEYAPSAECAHNGCDFAPDPLTIGTEFTLTVRRHVERTGHSVRVYKTTIRVYRPVS